jgi:hypothetical protein
VFAVLLVEAIRFGAVRVDLQSGALAGYDQLHSSIGAVGCCQWRVAALFALSEAAQARGEQCEPLIAAAPLRLFAVPAKPRAFWGVRWNCPPGEGKRDGVQGACSLLGCRGEAPRMKAR